MATNEPKMRSITGRLVSNIIPQLAEGAYYLEIVTQAGTNSKTLLKEPRRNRFPYLLYVGAVLGGGGDENPDIL